MKNLGGFSTSRLAVLAALTAAAVASMQKPRQPGPNIGQQWAGPVKARTGRNHVNVSCPRGCSSSLRKLKRAARKGEVTLIEPSPAELQRHGWYRRKMAKLALAQMAAA